MNRTSRKIAVVTNIYTLQPLESQSLRVGGTLNIVLSNSFIVEKVMAQRGEMTSTES